MRKVTTMAETVGEKAQTAQLSSQLLFAMALWLLFLQSG